jgi:phage-related protein
MAPDQVQPLKPIRWMASTKEDISNSPDAVKDAIGYALYEVQCGQKPATAKPLKGFGGAGVLEIVEDFDGDTWRAVYTVEIAGVIYVLDFFQKKAKKGISTPKHIIERLRRRRRDAMALERQKRQ